MRHTVQYYSRKKKRKLEPQMVFPISASMAMALDLLFESKKWDIVKGERVSKYERFIRTMELMPENEQRFLLELTQRFDSIPSSKYQDELVVAVKKLLANSEGKFIYFTRCVLEEDAGEIKSCDSLLYILKGAEIKQYLCLENTRIVKPDSLKPKDINLINSKGAIMVLVDDFIGSGDTALGAVQYVRKQVPALRVDNNVWFLSIAALVEGVNKLKDFGYPVITNHMYKKGISEYYEDDKLEEAIETMTSIESRLPGLLPDFHFGYMQSEGLVSMLRCPNNTFPIYWLLKGVAPYER